MQTMLLKTIKYTLLFVFVLLFFACRKNDKISTDPSLSLSFSTDTVFFDTVFTSVGSITKRLIVYNDNENKINISDIRLAGGNQSFYELNIDGLPGSAASDIEVPGNDSIFVFIKVTIDPNSDNLPFIIKDSIEFLTNGNRQDVKLVSWGQNARFLKDTCLTGIQVWDSLQPWVIFGHVRVDTGASLTIEKGARIYFHFDGYMAVSQEASLTVQGTQEHPVVFTGDRLDPYYRDLPGQWRGIYLDRGSKDHVVEHALIKNGVFGFSVDSVGSSPAPVLTLNNTIIQNTTSVGLYAYSTIIRSENCVIGNNGGGSLLIEKGGDYIFKHLTIANYWSASVRAAPALTVMNYTWDNSGSKIPNALSQALFANTIIYGSSEEEILLDSLQGTVFNTIFDHAILRTGIPLTNTTAFISCIRNEDPLIVDPQVYDFRIDTLSPAIDKGTDYGVVNDIDGNVRSNPPDLGAYEWMPSR